MKPADLICEHEPHHFGKLIPRQERGLLAAELQES
jgi:hypothetical protein